MTTRRYLLPLMALLALTVALSTGCKEESSSEKDKEESSSEKDKEESSSEKDKKESGAETDKNEVSTTPTDGKTGTPQPAGFAPAAATKAETATIVPPPANTSALPNNMLGNWKPTLQSYKDIMAGEDIPADIIEKLAAGATVIMDADKIVFHQEFMGEVNEDSKPYGVLSSDGGKFSLKITEPDGSSTTSVVSMEGNNLLIEEGGTIIRFTRPTK